MSKNFHYTVKGHWPFPMDMLRHDQASAQSIADQEKIDRYSTEHATDKEAFTDVEIRLVSPVRPNTARWESFGWSVPTDTDYTLMKETKRRARENQQVFETAMSKLSERERAVVASRLSILHES